MNKTQKSLLNAITALFNMAVTSIIGLVLSKTILNQYGSEYNGINASISQIVSTIMVLEGGFTLASNIALFKPFAIKDYDTINGILSATKKRFLMVGGIALAIGMLIALVYPLIVTSSMPYIEFFLLMLTVLIPSCFNLGINMKHRVILLTEQKEYIISIFSTITYALGNLAAIIAMNMGATILIARTIIMLSLLQNYFMIQFYCKRKYSFIDFKVKPLFEEIKGTKSVIALKLTSIAYTTLPIVAISMIPEKGVLLACILLLLTLFVGGFMFGLYGIVASTLMAAAFLAITEIGYIRWKVFRKDIKTFLKNMLPSLIICSLTSVIGMSEKLTIDGYFEFCVVGVLSVFVLSIITMLLYLIVNRQQLLAVLKMAKGLIIKRK